MTGPSCRSPPRPHWRAKIDAGAPADIFISADEPWMDDVQKNGMIRPGTRVSFLGNRLVLIAPLGGPPDRDPPRLSPCRRDRDEQAGDG